MGEIPGEERESVWKEGIKGENLRYFVGKEREKLWLCGFFKGRDRNKEKERVSATEQRMGTEEVGSSSFCITSCKHYHCGLSQKCTELHIQRVKEKEREADGLLKKKSAEWEWKGLKTKGEIEGFGIQKIWNCIFFFNYTLLL